MAGVLWTVYPLNRGLFTPTVQLTVIANRSGLVMDPGSSVTFNGVQVGRVTDVEETAGAGGQPKAKLTLAMDPRWVGLIPANADAAIVATTVFGSKRVSFSTPKNPVSQPVTSIEAIDVSAVTTEVNTLFETVTSIAEKVDPVKLNQTLTATAQALGGLGDEFGQSLVNGNEILGDLNPRMPRIRHDIQSVADLADVYVQTSPDLLSALNNAVITAHTLNGQQGEVDQALMAAVGFGNTGGDVVESGEPDLVRGASDFVPTGSLFDEYSPEIFCTIRNFHDNER